MFRISAKLIQNLKMYQTGYARRQGLGIRDGRIQKHAPAIAFPFEPIPDNIEQKAFAINPDNYEFFHGYASMFTLQNWTDIVIDERVYKSVDQYYQKMKAYDLTGAISDAFDDPKTKNYSAIARDILKLHNISRKTVDDWRTTCGVEIIQKAILSKVKQSSAFRQHLLATNEKLIVHSFASDDFFGSGCPIKYIKDWSESMQKSGMILKYPVCFPLTIATTKYVPTLAKGRNMLGAIYIALREQIKLGNLERLDVELTPVSELIKIVIKSAPRLSETLPKSRRSPSLIISNLNETPITKLRDLRIQPSEVHQPVDPNQAYLQQQYPGQMSSQMYSQQSVASNYTPTNQRYVSAQPVRYSQEPEIMDVTPQRTLEDVYSSQQQQSIRQSIATLAAQHQDFSADIDQQNVAFANIRRIPEAPRPPNIQSTSNFQTGYEWTWRQD